MSLTRLRKKSKLAPKPGWNPERKVTIMSSWKTSKNVGCVSALLLLVIIMGVPAEAADGRSPDASTGLLIAIDLSGSVRPYFMDIQDTVMDLLEALPDGSRLSIVRFDEKAEELARTSHLTSSQRETIQDRLRSLSPEGKWTDFLGLVEQLDASTGALEAPLLIVIFTDAKSDPAPGTEFNELDRLLQENFAGREDVNVLLMLPEENITPGAQTRVFPQILPLDEATPQRILSLVPLSPAPDPQEPALRSPRLLLTGGIAILLGLSVVAFLYLRDWEGARSRRGNRQEDPSSNGPCFEMVGRCGETVFNLGPTDDIERISIGTAAECDIPVLAPEERNFELIINHRGGRYMITNNSDLPVGIGRAELSVGETTRLGLPAELCLEEGLKVYLALRPKHRKTQPDEEVMEQETMEVRDE